MDSPTQPNFIPHEAVVPVSSGRRSQGGGLAELLFLVSVIFFIISLALGAGVFLYTQYLQSSNQSKLDQLNSAEAAFDPTLVQQLTRLDTRMSAAQSLLSAHLAPSELFTMLDQSTVQDISFSSLNYDATDPQQITLVMAGVAGSVNSIALQAQVFSQSGVIQSPIFSNIDAEPDGVHFDFTALVNPTAISYESYVSGASQSSTSQSSSSQTQTQAPTQTQTQTPAAPTSPFRAALRQLKRPLLQRNNNMTRNIFTIIFICGAIAIFFFYTDPAYSGMQTLSAQNGQYNAALDKATQLQQIKQTLLSRYNSFDPNALTRLSTMLPDQVDNIRLILDLDNLAGQYGMALQNVDISSPDTQSGSVVSSIADASQPYDSLTIQFSTRGTYQQFMQFLTALESSLRLVDLVTLSIAPSGVANGTAGPLYNYTMTVQTYWLR